MLYLNVFFVFLGSSDSMSQILDKDCSVLWTRRADQKSYFCPLFDTVAMLGYDLLECVIFELRWVGEIYRTVKKIRSLVIFTRNGKVRIFSSIFSNNFVQYFIQIS